MVSGLFIKRFILLIGILFLGYSDINAQKYDFKTYSVNDGLPSSYVYDVIIDDLGLVWFATANGLVKYDGKVFTNYDSENGLKDELISDIFKDQEGNLFVSTEFGGVSKFYQDSLIYIPELSVLDTLHIHFIEYGPNGTMWFGTDENGIYEWDKAKGVTQILSTDNGLPSNQIWDFTMDKEGRFWISTSKGVALYQRDGGVSYTLTKQNGLSGELAYQVYEVNNGDKWVPTSDGITIIKPDFTTKIIKEINGLNLGYVYSISEDESGSIWIGTERRGLFIYDGNTYTQIKKRNGLSSNFIYRLIKDTNGDIWIATNGDGVSILRDRDFIMYDSSSELNANSIFSTLQHSDGSIWVGTENGISNLKDNKFTNYTIPEKYFDEGEIWDIEELPNGNIITLGIDYDIFEFDGQNFFRPEFFDAIYEYYVNDIFVDKEDGSVWFAASEILLKYKDGELLKFPPPDEEYWQTELIALFKDSRGYYWVGTHAGLAKFDEGTFKYFTSNEGLEGGSIYDIKEDQKGNLWVATTKGIYILCEFEDGLPTKIIPFETLDLYMQETIFLQFDQQGNLWQATNGGLNYYNLSNWEKNKIATQKHYPFNDFGNGIEFNGLASVLENDGTLWFGSNSRGLIKYTNSQSDTDLQESSPPQIYLREVLANNDLVYCQFKPELDDKNIILDYDENNLNIRFNGIDFKNPNRISYKYKLDGFDKDWEYSNDITDIRYTSIPPGKYNFIVQAKSIKSDWGEPIAISSIEIMKPYWNTIPFYLVVGLTFILLIAVLIRITAERLEKKHLKILVDEQTKDIQSALDEKEVLIKEIHHRVKNNLAVVSGLLELQSWNIEDGAAKEALHESKMRVLAMAKIHENLYQNKDLAKVEFKTFLDELLTSVSATMKNSDHDVTINLECEETHIDVNVGIPIGLIVNELISNCYKHAFEESSKGEIHISFKTLGNAYHLLIRDDGKGTDFDILDQTSKSLGLTLVKSLCSQIKAEIMYSGKNGSTFDIKIPKLKEKSIS